MLISVITVNYNNCRGLEKTLKSVFEQKFRNYEHIVVDGASDDDSKEVLLKYQEYLSFWVSEADNGIYHAMNKGIKAAKGEYLLFLNSGDYLYNNRVFERVYKDLSGCDIHIGAQLNLSSNSYDITYAPKPESLTTLFFYDGTINHQSTFIKKNLFEKYGLYDENLRIVSDWKFFFKVICLEDCNVTTTKDIISCFEPGGISRTNEELRQIERKAVIDEFISAPYLKDYENLNSLYKSQGLLLVKVAMRLEQLKLTKIIKQFFSKVRVILRNKKQI